MHYECLLHELSKFEPAFGTLSARQHRNFVKKRIRSTAFSRSGFRRAQELGTPRVYSKTPTTCKLSVRGMEDRNMVLALLGGDPSRRIGVIKGDPGQTKTGSWKVQTILKRWESGTSPFAITDFSLGSARLRQYFQWNFLKRENLLSLEKTLAAYEVCGPVLSTAGHITNEHLDDPDIWNSCVVGKKIWFLWSMEEHSQRYGRDSLFYGEKTTFNVDSFLSMDSSRWALVEDGTAFYCPAHYLHRVTCLSRYLGVGTFLVTKSSSQRLLAQWESYGSQWEEFSKRGFVGSVQRASEARWTNGYR